VERNDVHASGIAADADTTISHFIPSVELTGSRDEKLRKLETLMIYLEQLRRSLAGDTTKEPARAPNRAHPVWGWFVAGMVVGAVSILLLLRAGAL
jgi:hypothetical protein